MQLVSSPLQSFTDYRWRNAFQKHFGGIDYFYAPYIRLNGKLKIKPVYERDLLFKNNRTLTVVPQVMTNDAEEFLFVAKYVKSLGYDELNWNLGCPYPMVTNRCLGSGLIADPVRIDKILDKAHREVDLTISMKMRMGYETAYEILDVFPILEKYPLRNIGIHARIGKQLYKGGVDLDGFQRCIEHTNHELYYNGDITSVSIYRELQQRFPTINTWMLGRGLIADPCLPAMIKSDSEVYPDNRIEQFRKFHNQLFYEFEQKLSGEKHVIMKMCSYWEYFATAFPDSARAIKKITKTKSFDAYEVAFDNLIEQLASLLPTSV